MLRRTPLKRMQGLKRGGFLRKKAKWKAGAPLASSSKKKAIWNRLYSAEKNRRMALNQTCEKCGKEKATDGHHPYGQLGEWIMIFVMLCRGCHDVIHFTSPAQAKLEGWLCDWLKISNFESAAVKKAREWWEANRGKLWPRALAPK